MEEFLNSLRWNAFDAWKRTLCSAYLWFGGNMKGFCKSWNKHITMRIGNVSQNFMNQSFTGGAVTLFRMD